MREVARAYRELGMIEVREVLRRFTLGEPVRAIARGTRVDRKTVAKYIAAGVAPGLCRGSTLPTDAQVAAIIAAIRPPHIGRPAVYLLLLLIYPTLVMEGATRPYAPIP